MKYIVDHIPCSEYTRPGDKGVKESITVHNTGLPGVPAVNFRKSLARADNMEYASFHIVVDDTQAIECIPLDETAYHCAHEYGNAHSIGIEICEVEGAEHKAAELIASMLNERGWGTDRVTTHQRWNGKYCPRLLLPKWDSFIELIKSKMKRTITGGGEGMKPVVVPYSVNDYGAALICANSYHYPIVSKEDLREDETPIQIGGDKPVRPGCRVISGNDRIGTAEQVLKTIRQSG